MVHRFYIIYIFIYLNYIISFLNKNELDLFVKRIQKKYYKYLIFKIILLY